MPHYNYFGQVTVKMPEDRRALVAAHKLYESKHANTYRLSLGRGGVIFKANAGHSYENREQAGDAAHDFAVFLHRHGFTLTAVTTIVKHAPVL